MQLFASTCTGIEWHWDINKNSVVSYEEKGEEKHAKRDLLQLFAAFLKYNKNNSPTVTPD